MLSTLALSFLLTSPVTAAAPLDVKATFGEQVEKDIEALKGLKSQGPVDGAGRCLKSYMQAVQFEKSGNSSVQQQFRACASACGKNLPSATVDGAKEIASRYAALCREKSGEKEPATAAPTSPAGPVRRTKAAGACDSVSTKGACLEYPSFGMRTEKDEQKVCEAVQGAWKHAEGCPVEGQLGACIQAGTKQIQRWYDAAANKGLTTAQAKDACAAMHGTFVAPEKAGAAAGPANSARSGRPTTADLEQAAAAEAPLLAKKDVAGAEKALTEKLGPPQRKSVDAGLTSWFTEVKGASCDELRLSNIGGGVPPKAKVIPAPPSECK